MMMMTPNFWCFWCFDEVRGQNNCLTAINIEDARHERKSSNSSNSFNYVNALSGLKTLKDCFPKTRKTCCRYLIHSIRRCSSKSHWSEQSILSKNFFSLPKEHTISGHAGSQCHCRNADVKFTVAPSALSFLRWYLRHLMNEKSIQIRDTKTIPTVH